jgi:hypothetical protein
VVFRRRAKNRFSIFHFKFFNCHRKKQPKGPSLTVGLLLVGLLLVGLLLVGLLLWGCCGRAAACFDGK